MKATRGSASVEMILAIPFISALLAGFAIVVAYSLGGISDTLSSFYESRGISMFCAEGCGRRGGSGKIVPSMMALPPDLSNEILRGGDTPSPYCRSSGGYRLCEL